MSEDDTKNPPVAVESLGVFVLFSALYLSTAATHFLGGDSGLFAVVFADGGYGHPPGYPLYSAYLRAMAWLPATSPAHGAALATALLGAGAVALLYAAARRWRLGRVSSAFGAVAFGLAPHVWLYHSQPEVFALNHLLVAAILWAAAPDAPLRGTRRVAVLGLLAGLGLSHHHPIVLGAPIGFWGVYRGTRETDGWLQPIGAGIAALCVGLLPYVYLLAVEHWELGWHWRDPTSLRDLSNLFLRKDYGTFRLNPGEQPAGAGTQIWFWMRSVPRDLLVVPPALAVLGLVAGLREAFAEERTIPEFTPAAALCLLGSLAAAGPFFAALLPRNPEGLNVLYLRRFHLMSELYIAFLAAFGAAFAQRRWIRPRAAGLAVVLLSAGGLVMGYDEVQHRHVPTVEQYVLDTFTHLEDDAVVVGTGDHHFFGALYLQRALGRSPDIDYVDPQLLAHRWYNRRVVDRLGISYPYRGEDVDTDALFGAILQSGRPLYVTHRFHEGLFSGWRTEPIGTVVRIRPPDANPRHPAALFRENRRLYREFQIATRPMAPAGSWARLVLDEYASTWRTLADALDQVDRPEMAARAREYARKFAPWGEN